MPSNGTTAEAVLWRTSSRNVIGVVFLITAISIFVISTRHGIGILPGLDPLHASE